MSPASNISAGTPRAIATAELHEVPVDDLLLAFDGRVLEVFNLRDGPFRFHVARMRIDRPLGRKGSLVIRLRDASRSAGQVYLEVPPTDRPAVEDLLAEVEEAMAAGAAEPLSEG